jgi:hypothetical protein
VQSSGAAGGEYQPENLVNNRGIYCGFVAHGWL